MNFKKIFSLVLVALMVVTIISCRRQARVPQAGQAKTADLILLFPKNTQGIFAWDFHRAITTSLAKRSLEDKEIKPKIEEFKAQTSIDPEKDVFLIVGGMISGEKPEPLAVAIINLRYEPEKLLSFIKQKSPQLEESVYGKNTIYQMSSEKENKQGFVFYDKSNIFFGETEAIKKVIDVCEKKADNLLQNAELNSLIKTADTKAMLWSAFLLPPEAMAELAKSNAMLSPLESLRTLLMSFDYKNKTLVAEIKAMGAEEAQNKQIAEFLTGMRAIGVMAASRYPEVVDVFNRLEIASSAQQVSLSFSLPEDLLTTLSERMKKEVEANLPKLKPKEN